MLGIELRKVPVDDELRMRVDGYDLDDVAAVVATVGTTSFASVDPGARARRARACRRRVAPRRRGLRRLFVDLRGGALVGRRCRARRQPGRQPAQVAARAHGLLPRLDGAAGRVARGVHARSRVPADVGRCVRALGVRPGARPALPLAEALGGAALLRARSGCARSSASTSVWPSLFAGWVEESPAGSSSRRSVSRSSSSGGTARTRRTRRLLERVNASGEIFITHTKLDGRYVLRLAVGNARTTEDDVRRAWDVLNKEAER